jgi:hypothetical protein
MRRPDESIRTAAWVLAILAGVSAIALVLAYAGGRSPLTWWVMLVGSTAGAVHYHRRSRR